MKSTIYLTICIILLFVAFLLFSKEQHKDDVLLNDTTVGIENPTTTLNGNKKNTSKIPSGLEKIYNSYKDCFDSVDSKYLYWKDGSCMIYDDETANKSFKDLLNNACLKDQMMQKYTQGKAYKIPIQMNHDPGRIRNDKFFRIMYGKTKKEVVRYLTNINWFGRKLLVSTKNGIDKKLLSILKELKKLPKKYHKYFTTSGGTFNWRNIAGTRRKSAHSFGIAIDINVKYSNYWRWSSIDSKLIKYKNKIPIEIVEIFEKYGFIWGGKWYHYDTMHFEYRPELLN